MPSKINKTPDFEAMGKAIIKQLPHNVSQQALSHFKGSFRKQGFTDRSFVAWPKRKDDLGHKILMNTNSLMNDLKVRLATINNIIIGTDLPHADAHNNGAKYSIPITAKMRKFFWAMYIETDKEKWKWMALSKKKRMAIRIPKRQFIGNSAELNKNIDTKIIETIITTFNK
jgi:phage gpG-like protein